MRVTNFQHFLDDDGNILGPNQPGQLAIDIQGSELLWFKGYLNQGSKSIEGGFYYTGDTVERAENGCVFFVGRSDDVITSSGYRIGPFDVESALIEHPAVVESAVVSSPDETRGEVVKAFIILASGFTGSEELTREIQNYVKSVTAPFKYPRKVEYVKELPKTVSGKIRRVELRAAEWA